MAALQEVLKRSRRSDQFTDDSMDSGSAQQASVTRALLEHSLYGFDVVPAAIHLAASTLSMSETSQVITEMNLWRMRHGIYSDQARLGSLDLLSTSDTHGNAARLGLFEGNEDANRIHGKGEDSVELQFPAECDLIIANPPYTRAGGPGDKQETAWNPIFGSLMDKNDQRRMNESLRRALKDSPAGVYSGLGSAFLVLAYENIRIGGRIAFVLPSAAVTGTSWRRIRSMLLRKYQLDWVVTSHDPRQRSAKAGLPGRIFASFSESTTIPKTLVVATRVRSPNAEHVVRFLNLHRNLTETIDAIALTRSLLQFPLGEVEVEVGKESWGEIRYVRQSQLSECEWTYTAFFQSRVVDAAEKLLREKRFSDYAIPIAPLGDGWNFGPYHMQIRNPKQGLFYCDEQPDIFRPGYPALWHHSAKKITTMEVSGNAWLRPRPEVREERWKAILARGSRLQIACELRHNTQRLGAVLTDQPMLGVRSWFSLQSANRRDGGEETLCLWLNSTLGMLLRVVHGNRPYPGRSLITHTNASDLPVLDIAALTEHQLKLGKEAYDRMCGCVLNPVHCMNNDSVRQDVDRALSSVLGYNIADTRDKMKFLQQADFAGSVRLLANALVLEPNISGGKARAGNRRG